MKTQISVLVKDETIFSKAMTTFWFVNIFQKAKMLVCIDGCEHKLKASKRPYTFDVEPGTHSVEFRDPKEGQKRFTWKLTGLFVSLGFGLGASNSFGDFQMNMIEGEQLFRMSLKENGVECTLQDGDILKLSCKSNGRASVKVKVI